MLDFLLLNFLDRGSHKLGSLIVLTKFEEVNRRADESEVHRWLDLRSTLEPFEGG